LKKGNQDHIYQLPLIWYFATVTASNRILWDLKLPPRLQMIYKPMPSCMGLHPHSQTTVEKRIAGWRR
jgi:hypothetical protein